MREKVKCTIQDLVRPSPVSYIVPNLFLGDKHIACDQAELQRLNVTHVVNCARGLLDPFVSSSSSSAAAAGVPSEGSLRSRSPSLRPSPGPAGASSSAAASASASASSLGSGSDEEMCDAEEALDLGDDDNAQPAADCWSPTYHRCELLDSSRAEGDFEQALAPAFAFIDAALAVERGKGGSVLIHCCAGRSRGPAVMTAYLIHRYRWSLDKAFTFVCQARPVVCPNRGFLSALLRLEKRLLGANTMCLRHNGHHHTLVSLRHSSK